MQKEKPKDKPQHPDQPDKPKPRPRDSEDDGVPEDPGKSPNNPPGPQGNP